MMQFSDSTEATSSQVPRFKKSGRTYIPHGKGEEKPYKPHARHITVSYTECGPDWNSTIRCLPEPDCGDRPRETLFYPPLQRLRSFPRKANTTSKAEYKFYPSNGTATSYSDGKVTVFDGVHKASQRTTTELSDLIRFGHRGNVFDSRDGYLMAAPGDKPYKTPEYSPSFHKFGSTRPVVDFGGIKLEKADTFIPLHPLPDVPVKPFSQLEAERKKQAEINEVKNLQNWRPASPLSVPVTDWR